MFEKKTVDLFATYFSSIYSSASRSTELKSLKYCLMFCLIMYISPWMMYFGNCAPCEVLILLAQMAFQIILFINLVILSHLFCLMHTFLTLSLLDFIIGLYLNIVKYKSMFFTKKIKKRESFETWFASLK